MFLFSVFRAKVVASGNDVTIQRAPGCNPPTRLAAVGHSGTYRRSAKFHFVYMNSRTTYRLNAARHADVRSPIHLRATTLHRRLLC